MSAQRVAMLRNRDRRLALPIMTHPGLDRIGKRVIECVTDANVQVAAMTELCRAYPTAAATSVMDLTVEAEAFGASIAFFEHEIPTVTGRLVTSLEEVDRLPVPSTTAGRLSVYQEAARGAVRAIHDRPVLASCIGPFSLAARLFGVTEIMTACLLEPETIQLLLEKCTALLVEHVRVLKAAGTDGIVMAEPAAGLLSEELCDAFSSAHVRKVVEAVQSEDYLFVLHNCGNRGHVTSSMVSTGARALHFGNQANMVEALRVVPPDRLVLGNLDPAGLMKLGTPAAVEAAARALLAATIGHPNFILSTGCDMPAGVSEANLAALFAAVSSAEPAKRPVVRAGGRNGAPRARELIHGRFTFSELRPSSHDIGTVLGYPDGELPDVVGTAIEEVVARGEGLWSIEGGCVLSPEVSVDRSAHLIRAQGLTFEVGRIVSGQLSRSTTLAAFLCTAGKGIEDLSRSLMASGDHFTGFVADTIGSLVVEAAMDRLHRALEDLVAEEGLGVTNRYSPGYCEWDVAEQQKLFQLFPPGYCGVTLTDTSLMRPIKTVSGFIGVGPEVHRAPYTCGMCDLKDCLYRRLAKERARSEVRG